MTAPHIHGRFRGFSVSDALETIGRTLAEIREADRLTWADVGRVLGKSDDRARDYANALSEMPVSAFLLACREWNGRFGNPVLAAIGQKLVPVDGADCSDTEKLTRILAFAHLLAGALADNGLVDDHELLAMSQDTLDAAARGIDALRIRRSKLTESTAGAVVPLRP